MTKQEIIDLIKSKLEATKNYKTFYDEDEYRRQGEEDILESLLEEIETDDNCKDNPATYYPK